MDTEASGDSNVPDSIERVSSISSSRTVVFNPIPSPDDPPSQILNDDLHAIHEEQSINAVEDTRTPSTLTMDTAASAASSDVDYSPQKMQSIDHIEIPLVDSLQPDELCLCIQETIAKMNALDPAKDGRTIIAYKYSLIEQLEKLQKISNAIDSLNSMQKTADNLPKNAMTGYPDINAMNLALREHCFFAEHIHVFGMLLIEISDYNKVRDEYGSSHADQLMSGMCDTMNNFAQQHLLFHSSVNRLVVLLYVQDEQDLMRCGKECIRILTQNSFDVLDQALSSDVSVGAAIYQRHRSHGHGDEDEKNPDQKEAFNFRDWMENAENGLEKAISSGLKNQCCIARKDDVVRAILQSANQGASSTHNKHKSSLSMLNRSRGHRTTGSQAVLSRFTEMASNLTPQQIRASIKLYDKLQSIKTGQSGQGDNKLLVLSICRRFQKEGANFNFQHPKHGGNSVVMLCCIKNFGIMIKYFCLKMSAEIDFNAVNNEGNTALMLAVAEQDMEDDVIQLLAAKSAKEMVNAAGKTAKLIAMDLSRSSILEFL